MFRILASNNAKDEFRGNRRWPVYGTAFTLDRLEGSGDLSLYRKSSNELVQYLAGF